MKHLIKQILFRIAPLFDLILFPLSFLSALWSFFIRSAGFDRMPLARKIYLKVGVVPVRNHYYEPFFNPELFQRPLNEDRILPGIELNETSQLLLLDKLNFQDELRKFPRESSGKWHYNYDNTFFSPVDAEFLYAIIRYFRPRKVIEVGSGNSTLMMLNAFEANRNDDSEYNCDLTCIEPYEVPWLEECGISVLRKRVEEVDPTFFSNLDSGDILFIDSSHVIKPQGDIPYLYLQVLPLLRSGVLVHIHDIMTPRDYFHTWVVDKLQLWNEQYVMESFLSMNKDFAILAALNFLKHHHFDHLSKVCPILEQQPSSEPGSFWLGRL